jgi:hypothetical protein
MIVKPFLLLFFPFLALSQNADVIFTNAKIWTVDPAMPEAQSVAVKGDKIVAVGTNAEMRPLTGPKTQIVDLGGRLMLPGFIDNHTHFSSGGFQLQSVDLRDATSEREFARRIKERASKYPKRWITGGDWDHDNWPGGNLPTKELVDEATPSTLFS